MSNRTDTMDKVSIVILIEFLHEICDTTDLYESVRKQFVDMTNE